MNYLLNYKLASETDRVMARYTFTLLLGSNRPLECQEAYKII